MLLMLTHAIHAILMLKITKQKLMVHIDWIMSANVEYLHSKWRFHLNSPERRRPIFYTENLWRPAVQRNHRTRLRFGGAADLLWIWWLIKWAIFKVPYEYVQIKRLHSGYTQWDAIQLISQLAGWHLRSITSLTMHKYSTDTVLNFIHISEYASIQKYWKGTWFPKYSQPYGEKTISMLTISTIRCQHCAILIYYGATKW